MKVIAVSNFVKRQTPESEFSHFDGSWDELLDLVQGSYIDGKFKQGYRDGVILVEVNPNKFYTSVVDLVDGDVFAGEYKSRQPGEQPRKGIWLVRNEKQKLRDNV